MNDELHVALDEADFLAVFPLTDESQRAADRHGPRSVGRAGREP